jgi:hypothetical protein
MTVYEEACLAPGVPSLRTTHNTATPSRSVLGRATLLQNEVLLSLNGDVATGKTLQATKPNEESSHIFCVHPLCVT